MKKMIQGILWDNNIIPDVIIDNLTSTKATTNLFGITAVQYEWHRDKHGKPYRVVVW